MHSKKFKNSQFIISLSINQQNNAVYEKYCYMQYKKSGAVFELQFRFLSNNMEIYLIICYNQNIDKIILEGFF